jgi:CelD/BcsL family acetyltransferase involved in cellulose biosynthesis
LDRRRKKKRKKENKCETVGRIDVSAKKEKKRWTKGDSLSWKGERERRKRYAFDTLQCRWVDMICIPC